MARALAVLAVAALLAVLLGRSYATCIDYWNSRQYRGPDLASALSICLREEPLPVLIALFLVVIAAGLARGIGPRAAVSLAAMALGVVALLGCAIEATSLLPVMRTGDGAGLALGLHWLTFLRLPGAAALVLGGALLYPHVAGGGAQGRFWTVLALARRGRRRRGSCGLLGGGGGGNGLATRCAAPRADPAAACLQPAARLPRRPARPRRPSRPTPRVAFGKGDGANDNTPDAAAPRWPSLKG
jgi:hypothetical protein